MLLQIDCIMSANEGVAGQRLISRVDFWVGPSMGWAGSVMQLRWVVKCPTFCVRLGWVKLQLLK